LKISKRNCYSNRIDSCLKVSFSEVTMFFKKKEQDLTIQSSIKSAEETENDKIKEAHKQTLICESFKVKVENDFLELKENSEFMELFENFLPQMPTIILTNKDCYTYFEYLILQKNKIGKLILWSLATDIDDIEAILRWEERGSYLNNLPGKLQELEVNLSGYKYEIVEFVEDKFNKMTRFLKSIVKYEDESEYDFLLLRIIQICAPSFCRGALTQVSGIDFGDIEYLSLEECVYRYYKKFEKISCNDPVISLLTMFLLNYDKFEGEQNRYYYNYPRRRTELINFIKDNEEKFAYKIFEETMSRKNPTNVKGYSLIDIDVMGGDEFEKFISMIFTKMGYVSNVTQHTRDFGVDVIAEKNGVKIAIQAKCYSGSVSPSAIQEIVAGMKYYNCQKGIVVTNSFFTKAAIELAQSNSIQLWDRNILDETISKYT